MKKIFVCLLILLFVKEFEAQQRNPKVEGYVNSESKPLAGANIIIKGTTIGAITNKDGYYYLANLPRGNFILKASFVGYKSKETEVRLRGRHLIKVNFDLEEDLIQTESIIVSASRQEENRKDASVVVNVLNPRTYESTNSLNLADGLSFQSGLRLETNCQNCGFQQVRINGLEGPYSQILIDSKPIFSALNSVYGIEQIPANMIDRVEIVRGGGSALYGSNAIGGTINIITKTPSENSFQIASNFSFLDYRIPDQTITLNTTLVNEDYNTGISVFGAYRKRMQFDENGDGFSEIGKIDNHTLGFKSFYKPSLQSKINLEFHTLREFRRGGNKFDLQPHESDITEQIQHQINSGGIDYSYLKSSSAFNIYFSLQNIERKSYYGAQQNPNAYGSTTDLTIASGIQYTGNLKHLIFAPAVFTAGFEYQSNRLKDETPGYNREINQNVEIGGIYVQSEWSFNNIKYLVGARFDKNNLIDDIIISPRTTLLYRFAEEIQTRITYAKGYRAPQAFDEDLHITAVGGEVILIQLAEGLKTENSNTFSASLDLYPSFGKMQTNILLETFYTKLNDVFVLNEVGIDPHGNKIVERQNGSGAEVYGLNFETKFVPNNHISLQLGFTAQRSLYIQPQQWSDDSTLLPIRQMPRTPDKYGYFTLSYRSLTNFDFSVSGIYTGSMYVPHYAGFIQNDLFEKSEDFFECNIKMGYTFVLSNKVNIQLNGGIQNIINNYQKDFDKGIFRDAGYIYGPSRPRTLFVGLKVSG
ncbi:MAG: TonB-dependent receptor [Melioribacteraceae bacterium]|nr:TonB-dependent receptor [Melioribacteraceae bacterium]